MAKDFTNKIKPNRTEDIKEITKSFFSTETISKVDGNENKEVKTEVAKPSKEVARTKRKYTKLNDTENKEKMVHVRLSETDLERYKKSARKNGCRSFSEYIIKCLEKGL